MKNRNYKPQDETISEEVTNFDTQEVKEEKKSFSSFVFAKKIKIE